MHMNLPLLCKRSILSCPVYLALTIKRVLVDRAISLLFLGTFVSALIAEPTKPMWAKVDRGNHGIEPTSECDTPKCLGDALNCWVDVEYNDDCGDTIKLLRAPAIVDPNGMHIPVPASGNGWILVAEGNTTAQVGPFDNPVFVGPPFSTYYDLPGNPNPGYIKVGLDPNNPEDTYIIQPNDPTPLLVKVTIVWEDMCDHYDHAPCGDCPAGIIWDWPIGAVTSYSAPCCDIQGPQLICPCDVAEYTACDPNDLNPNDTCEWAIVDPNGNPDPNVPARFWDPNETHDPNECWDPNDPTEYTGDCSVWVSSGPNCDEDFNFKILLTVISQDSCASTCDLPVRVDDDIPPESSCPADITICPDGRIPSPNCNLVDCTDSCPGVRCEWAGDQSDGGSCPEIVTRTYRCTDLCGNTSECTQEFVRDDDIPPECTCPPDITICPGDPIPPPDCNDVVCTDNCPGVTCEWVGDDPDPNEIDPNTCPQTIFRTYRCTDVCGNTCECTQEIVIDDDIPPECTAPPDITICPGDPIPDPNCDAVTCADNCPGVRCKWVGDDPDPNEIDPNACDLTITRTYKCIDTCGNSSSCTQEIVIDDDIPPECTAPPDITICPGDPIPDPNCDAVTCADNCPGVRCKWVGDDPDPNEIDPNACDLTITRTYKCIDTCGNSSSCTQEIVIDDDEPPECTCPPDITICPGDPVPPPDCNDVVCTDNCPGVTCQWVGDDPDPNEIDTNTCPQTITRTYRCTDVCGNTCECEQKIVIDDDEPPECTCPPDITICPGDPIPPPDCNDVVCTDNCPGVRCEWVDDESDGGTCPEIITRTYQCIDVCGNACECTQKIVIDDDEPPECTCPSNITICPGDPIPPPDCNDVVCTDNCPGVTCEWVDDEPDGGTCPEIITRTYRCTDVCGNTCECEQKITVNDTIDPNIACPPDMLIHPPQTLPPPATNCEEFVAQGGKLWDNCDPNDVDPNDLICKWLGDDPNDVPCPFTITRTYSVTDKCDNVAICTQEIKCGEPPPIPAVSTVGQVLVGLLLLTGGMIAFRRPRQRPAA